MMDTKTQIHTLRLMAYSTYSDMAGKHEDWGFILDDTEKVELESYWLFHNAKRTIMSTFGPQDEMDYIVEILQDGGFEMVMADIAGTLKFPKRVVRGSQSYDLFVHPGVWEQLKKWNSDPVVKEIGEKLASGAYHKKCEKCGGTGRWVMFHKTVDCECGASTTGENANGQS